MVLALQTRCHSQNMVIHILLGSMKCMMVKCCLKFVYRACGEVGVSRHEQFEVPDLFEDKNIGAVVRCLFALGKEIQVRISHHFYDNRFFTLS